MLQITSSQNPIYKNALCLHSSRGRKDQDRILIFNEREVRRAAASRVKLCEVYFCSKTIEPEAMLDLQQVVSYSKPQLFDLSEALFAKLAFGDRVDSVIAIARRPDTSLDKLALSETPFVLVVESVEKPGNLGAIFRSADGAGVDAILVANPLTDVFHPNSIRASLGTVFKLPCAVAPAPMVKQWLAGNMFQVFVAEPHGGICYSDANFQAKTAVILGNEASGLSHDWQNFGSAISLPMLGIADSLNVSATAAIISYESRRQRRKSSSS